jgi:hypothetical protein
MKLIDRRYGERATKLVLITIFIGVLSIISERRPVLDTAQWIMLGLAVLRCGRMVAFELIFEPFRSIFGKTVPHDHAGMTTEAKYETGWRRAVGDLVTCPICAATWSALVLLLGLSYVPAFFQTLLVLLSAVSLAELGHETIERLCWGAAASRKQSK